MYRCTYMIITVNVISISPYFSKFSGLSAIIIFYVYRKKLFARREIYILNFYEYDNFQKVITLSMKYLV